MNFNDLLGQMHLMQNLHLQSIRINIVFQLNQLINESTRENLAKIPQSHSPAVFL